MALDAGHHYMEFEMNAEEAVIRQGWKGLLGIAGLISTEYVLVSNSGPLRFVPFTTDGWEFDLVGPYCDGRDMDPSQWHQLRLMLDGYDWNLMEEVSNYILELGISESDLGEYGWNPRK